MKTPSKPTSTPWELALWSTITVLLAVWSAGIVRGPPESIMDLKGGRARDSHYSWVGDDYPAYYPMEVRDVIMFPEDTVHYPISGDDALQQWESQLPTVGEGWVCLGPEHRPFGLTMYHELHCLGQLRLALEDSVNQTYEAQDEHVRHCLNYLRTMTLCRADVTLEPVTDASVAIDLTQPHLCKDWVQVGEEVSRNAEQCWKPEA